MLEILSDNGHASDETLSQNLLGGAPIRESLPSHLFDVLGLALVEALVHAGIIDYRHLSNGIVSRAAGLGPNAVERVQGLEHGHDVLAGHSWTDAAAH